MPVAVITGSSSGLGREYIKAVINEFLEIDEIWLIARRIEHLTEIAKQYPQKKCKVIGLDLAKDDSYSSFGNILSENKPAIKILISNAAIDVRGDFDKVELAGQMHMCDLNIKGATAITHLCLPYMNEGSIILETCSVSAFAPNPHMNVYSATKAYLLNFSVCLREELKPRGINVCAVCPGWMDTEMNAGIKNKTGSGFFTLPKLDVKELASESLKAAKKGKAVFTLGVFYKFYRLLAKVFPHNLIMKFSKM